jgi:hypothetical protein
MMGSIPVPDFHADPGGATGPAIRHDPETAGDRPAPGSARRDAMPDGAEQAGRSCFLPSCVCPRRDVRLPEAGRNAPVAFVVIDLINRVLRRRAEDAAKNAIRRLAPA